LTALKVWLNGREGGGNRWEYLRGRMGGVAWKVVKMIQKSGYEIVGFEM